MMRRVNAFQIDILATITVALGGYVLADAMRFSAPLEAVVAGLALRRFNIQMPGERIAHSRIDGFWEMIDEVQNSLLFVLLGLEAMAIALNSTAVRCGLTAILSVNLVRLFAVALLLTIVRLVRHHRNGSIFVLTWGGLRGGLSIALALSVPEGLGRSWMLGATYLVVVFSILIQGGLMNRLLGSRSPVETAALH
jgi:monovalent cation:H+ antiporter, CPA1 family